IASNYGADENLAWVAPVDISAAVAEELEKPVAGNKVRYVASDELSGHETARILGEAIGKPDLKWLLISNEQSQGALEAAGMNPQIAAGLVEMFASQHSGLLMEDYYRNRPAALGMVKLTDFGKEFADTFNKA
ncbi:MAG: NAD-dependent dehydratase, partial [Mucilaginibacter sp.]